MRALTIVYILLACTVAGYTQTTATYDNVRARQQLTLNGHTLTSVLQTIDSLSTHAQGVTAKAVYDYIATKYSTVSAGAGIDVVKAGSNYTISLDTLKRLHFRTDSTYSGGVGTMRWNLTDGTLDLGLLGGNVTLQLGQESVQRVKHADNSGLVEGNVVYIVGSSGDNLTVRYARANAESTSANTFGVMTESASGGDKAFCTTFGLVRNINTSNLTEGGMVWLSKDTAGAMTAVRPTAPNHGVEIGFCVRKHATQGVIFVTIQNGYELRELHDVYAPSPANNQGLLWKSANSRWEAVELDTSLYNEGQLSLTSTIDGLTITSSTEVPGLGYTKVSFNDQAGIYLEKNGDIINVYNTGDLLDNNEGTLGISAGAANTSVITSNTSGANGVTVSGGTGIAVTETTSTNGGTITVTNSAPDQTVSLTNGGGIGVTGTYPSFTLTATDASVTNEGTLGVGAGTSTSSVITSNTSGASGVTINAIGGISISETTSSNGGSINISATDQSVSNEGILGVAINPGADAWLRSNTSTANHIGLVATNNMTITSSNNSNGGQIVFDSKAQIDTFSVSGSTLSLSLKNDGEPAKTVTLPGGGGGGTVTGTGVAGRAAFWRSTSAISSDANFAWDSTNVQLNIGNPLSPAGKLNVKGGGSSSSTVNLRLTDIGNTELIKVLDNGSTNIGTGFNWDNANSRLGIATSAANVPLSVNGETRTTRVAGFSATTTYADFGVTHSNGIAFFSGGTACAVMGQNGMFIGSGNLAPGAGSNCVIRGRTSDATARAVTIQNSTPSTLLQIENNGKFTYLSNSITGTTGNQTINFPSGNVNFAAGSTSLTVTNSLCTTSSHVFCTIRTNDSTATIKNVVPGSGSFTINLSAAATGVTSVGFFIIN